MVLFYSVTNHSDRVTVSITICSVACSMSGSSGSDVHNMFNLIKSLARLAGLVHITWVGECHKKTLAAT